MWGKDQKTLQLGWTQQGRARSKYRKTALIDKRQKPQYHRGVSGTLWHTVPDSSCTGTKTIPDETSVHSNSGDFGAISVTERGCAAPIVEHLNTWVERHLSDRFCATLCCRLNKYWGSSISFSGYGNSLIWSSRFGILKRNQGEIRDWKNGRRWVPKNNPRDYGIEEPFWRHSVLGP